MKKANYTFETGRVGSGNIDLATGKLSVKHQIVNPDANTFPIGIALINKNKESKINLNQTLKKQNEGNNDRKFNYIDGDLNEHVLEEKYFYRNENGSRIYTRTDGNVLVRSDIRYNFDGRLFYHKYEVFVDSTSRDWLTLKTDNTGFIDADKFDLRDEEVIRVEQDISQLEKHIDALTFQVNEYKRATSRENSDLNKLQHDLNELHQVLGEHQLNLSVQQLELSSKQQDIESSALTSEYSSIQRQRELNARIGTRNTAEANFAASIRKGQRNGLGGI